MIFQDILNRNSKRGYWKATLVFCYAENTTATARLYNRRRVCRFRSFPPGNPPRKPALKNQNEIFPKPSPGGLAAVGGLPFRCTRSIHRKIQIGIFPLLCASDRLTVEGAAP